MQRNPSRCYGEKLSKDPWETNGTPIPETFPTRRAFFKVVGLGIAITVVQFGVFALLIIKPWH